MGLFLGFSNLWVSSSNFPRFEIYGFVSGFDVCMEGLIFHMMFWVCLRLRVGFGSMFFVF